MTEDLAALCIWLFVDSAIVASAKTHGKFEALRYIALYEKYRIWDQVMNSWIKTASSIPSF